ncbi:hypothetical protein E2C01_006776 [Portunus trituberculatus]|uniref:Uncharacterized protein n=1 Tax=Portunus trituberculatus TaxID=210409 RepID=A0A5B7D2R1_PORTR|nr:hypothetical protein [Portunus trituberculatus]
MHYSQPVTRWRLECGSGEGERGSWSGWVRCSPEGSDSVTCGGRRTSIIKQAGLLPLAPSYYWRQLSAYTLAPLRPRLKGDSGLPEKRMHAPRLFLSLLLLARIVVTESRGGKGQRDVMTTLTHIPLENLQPQHKTSSLATTP